VAKSNSDAKDLARLLKVLSVETRVRIVMAVGFAVGLAVHYLLLGKEDRHADAQR